jgi:subtilisin family serine protease
VKQDLKALSRWSAAAFVACGLGGGSALAADAGWLVRTTLDQPTAADFTDALGTPVDAVDHVSGDLYRVSVRVRATAAKALTAKTLEARARANAPGVVTRVQRNFTYKLPLHIDAAARARAASLPLLEEAVVDNPAVQPPVDSPSTGADPRVGNQWGISKSKSPEAWGIQRGNREMIVAVIDTGVDYNHEDLKNAMWRNAGETPGNGVDDDGNGFVDDVVGWDFADNDAFPFDKMSEQRIDGNPGHGTHCAGVVGAVGENATGISGVAPNISIMALRFITDKGEGTTADAIKAINYAVANGARVLSNSWGGEAGDEDDTELKNAITEAQNAGVLLVFAAGNGRNGVGYDNDGDAKPAIPASFDHDAIISVAAIDSGEQLGAFSNWGHRTVDLGAPGVKILSSVPATGKYEDRITLFGFPIADWSGTSMAAPHVAGALALIWSEYPELTAAEAKARLLAGVIPVAALSGKSVTGGMLSSLGSLK